MGTASCTPPDALAVYFVLSNSRDTARKNVDADLRRYRQEHQTMTIAIIDLFVRLPRCGTHVHAFRETPTQGTKLPVRKGCTTVTIH